MILDILFGLLKPGADGVKHAPRALGIANPHEYAPADDPLIGLMEHYQVDQQYVAVKIIAVDFTEWSEERIRGLLIGSQQ